MNFITAFKERRRHSLEVKITSAFYQINQAHDYIERTAHLKRWSKLREKYALRYGHFYEVRDGR